MKNRTTQKKKLPAVPVPDMSNLTKEQLKAEIEKGFADAAAGRVNLSVCPFFIKAPPCLDYFSVCSQHAGSVTDLQCRTLFQGDP